VQTGVIDASRIVEPDIASWDLLRLVHSQDYLDRMRDGTLSSDEVAQLELPWSREMVDGFRLMVGGTVRAAAMACGVSETPVAARQAAGGSRTVCHIGGGLHHAFASHGEGFCPFNDVAVATRFVQARGIGRVAIVDLDVHQGNGTAFIFNPSGAAQPPFRHSRGGAGAPPEHGSADQNVFTFSMHQQHNYPMWKPRGSLDIGLPDRAGDRAFMSELERALPTVMASRPQCVFYLAGADPYEDDQLGGLSLTKDGLRQRDRLVIETVRHAGIPLVITLAGGYARRLDDTVAIHAATIEEAIRIESRSKSR
jgi:acetoin utilization deacetylase AcuC-like enzyme